MVSADERRVSTSSWLAPLVFAAVAWFAWFAWSRPAFQSFPRLPNPQDFPCWTHHIGLISQETNQGPRTSSAPGSPFIHPRAVRLTACMQGGHISRGSDGRLMIKKKSKKNRKALSSRIKRTISLKLRREHLPKLTSTFKKKEVDRLRQIQCVSNALVPQVSSLTSQQQINDKRSPSYPLPLIIKDLESPTPERDLP